MKHLTLPFALAALLSAGAAFGQVDLQVHARQLPGWDARSREGRCEIRVWVDNRAEVRMRGDTIFVHTLEGARSRDEGSECSQPLPYNSVGNFQIRQIAGRNRVSLAQPPGRQNNFTATILIEDNQGGGDNYHFEVSWRADTDVANAPAPFFDDVRACQDAVRQRFLSQNGRGAYVDFDRFADRQGGNSDRRDNAEQNRGWGRGRNQGSESIQGRGSARSAGESRELTYSCAFDARVNRVLSADYRYAGESLFNNNRGNDGRRPLR